MYHFLTSLLIATCEVDFYLLLSLVVGSLCSCCTVFLVFDIQTHTHAHAHVNTVIHSFNFIFQCVIQQNMDIDMNMRVHQYSHISYMCMWTVREGERDTRTLDSRELHLCMCFNGNKSKTESLIGTFSQFRRFSQLLALATCCTLCNSNRIQCSCVCVCFGISIARNEMNIVCISRDVERFFFSDQIFVPFALRLLLTIIKWALFLAVDSETHSFRFN